MAVNAEARSRTVDHVHTCSRSTLVDGSVVCSHDPVRSSRTRSPCQLPIRTPRYKQVRQDRYPRPRPALVAQGIEQRFPKPCVGSSNLPGGTTAPAELTLNSGNGIVDDPPCTVVRRRTHPSVFGRPRYVQWILSPIVEFERSDHGDDVDSTGDLSPMTSDGRPPQPKDLRDPGARLSDRWCRRAAPGGYPRVRRAARSRSSCGR
jgi:hypothetical protein